MPDATPDVTPDARTARPREAGERAKERGGRGKGREEGEGKGREGAAARSKGGNAAWAWGPKQRKPSRAGGCKGEPPGALPPPLRGPTPSDAIRRQRRGPGHPPIRAESRRRLGVGCVGLQTDGVGCVGGPPGGVGRPSATGGRRHRRARGARPGCMTSTDPGLWRRQWCAVSSRPIREEAYLKPPRRSRRTVLPRPLH